MTELGQAPRTVARFDVTPHLPNLHAALEQQRRFRVDQLQELDAAAVAVSASASDEPRNEVTLLVRAAALAALAGIEVALSRVQLNCYGQCRSCDAAIALERLEILPAVKLCMPCQLAQEERARGRSAPTPGPPTKPLLPCPDQSSPATRRKS